MLNDWMASWSHSLVFITESGYSLPKKNETSNQTWYVITILMHIITGTTKLSGNSRLVQKLAQNGFCSLLVCFCSTSCAEQAVIHNT